MRQGSKKRNKKKMAGVKPAFEKRKKKDCRPVSIREGGKRNCSFYFNHIFSLLENRKTNYTGRPVREQSRMQP